MRDRIASIFYPYLAPLMAAMSVLLTLTWDEETFNNFFKKQRERQK